MTVQELVDWCQENGVSLDTVIAVREKDDHFVSDVYLDQAYFGNCRIGTEWERENIPRDEHGDLDYDQAPQMLIIDTGY